MKDDIPCCQADALRRVRMIPVNGMMTGITMLNEIIKEVKEMNLTSDQQIRDTLLRKVRVYNYIPKAAEEAYLKAIMIVFEKSNS